MGSSPDSVTASSHASAVRYGEPFVRRSLSIYSVNNVRSVIQVTEHLLRSDFVTKPAGRAQKLHVLLLGCVPLEPTPLCRIDAERGTIVASRTLNQCGYAPLTEMDELIDEIGPAWMSYSAPLTS
jgi:hypothetical protein